MMGALGLQEVHLFFLTRGSRWKCLGYPIIPGSGGGGEERQEGALTPAAALGCVDISV